MLGSHLRHAAGLVQQRLPAVGQREKVFSGLGQLDVAYALAPAEQLRTNLRLQRLNAVAEGGLGDEQRFGGSRQRTVLQYSPEGLHIGVVHGIRPFSCKL